MEDVKQSKKVEELKPTEKDLKEVKNPNEHDIPRDQMDELMDFERKIKQMMVKHSDLHLQLKGIKSDIDKIETQIENSSIDRNKKLSYIIKKNNIKDTVKGFDYDKSKMYT